ncbi:MAG: hypothetical protein EPO22_15000 [Dehalococcoidia bacterium]|nr:MAG: hypothetical protein EPO22_15000 [Dehalococcoidia bacterium]
MAWRWAEQEARCRASGLTVTVVQVLGSRQLREAVEWWAMIGWAPEEPVPTGGAVFGIDMGRIAWTFRRIEDVAGEPRLDPGR